MATTRNATPSDAALTRLIRTFLTGHNSKKKLTTQETEIVAEIFQTVLAKASSVLDENVLRTWLTADIDLERQAAEAISLQALSIPHGVEMLFDLVRQRIQIDARQAQQAMQLFRESVDCDGFVHNKSVMPQIRALMVDSPFAPLVDAFTDKSAGFRAELVARFEMYCEAGWAEKDLVHSMDPNAKNLSAAQKKIRDVIRDYPVGKTLTNAQRQRRNHRLVLATEERFNEISVPIHIFRAQVSIDGRVQAVYLAETSDISGFSLSTGKVERSGYVDCAMPYAGDPQRLLVSTTTSMLLRDSLGNEHQTARHFSGIEGAIQLGKLVNLRGFSETGQPVLFTRVDFVSYITPFFVDPLNNPNPSAFMLAMSGNTVGMHAINALQLFSEGDLVNESQKTFDQVLRARLNPLGAVCAWDPSTLDTPAKRLSKAVDVTVDAIRGLQQAAQNRPDIFKNDNGDTSKAIEALTSTLKAIRNSPDYTEELAQRLTSAKPNLMGLADVISQHDGTRAAYLRAALIHPLFSEEIRGLAPSPRDQLLMAGYQFLDQKNITRDRLEEQGHSTGTGFRPAEDSREGAIAQFCSSNLPAVHAFFRQHDNPLDHMASLHQDDARAIARLLEDVEGKAHLKVLEFPQPPSQPYALNQAFEALGKTWEHLTNLDPDNSMGVRSELLANADFHLRAHMNNPEHLEGLHTRLFRAMQAIDERGWKDTVIGRESLMPRLLNIAHTCDNTRMVDEVCRHVGRPYDQGGLSNNALVGRDNDAQLFMLPVKQEHGVSVPVSEELLCGYLARIQEWVRERDALYAESQKTPGDAWTSDVSRNPGKKSRQRT